MTYLPLKVPAGLYKNGTRYQARGRWWDAALVRFYQNTVQPVGGWQALVQGGTAEIPGAVLALDQCIGTNGASITAHTPDSGFTAWESGIGYFALNCSIQSNTFATTATGSGTTSQHNTTSTSIPHDDFEYYCDLVRANDSTSSQKQGFFFRGNAQQFNGVTNDGIYVYWERTDDSTVSLKLLVQKAGSNGQQVTAQTGVAWPKGTGLRLGVTVQNDAVQFWTAPYGGPSGLEQRTLQGSVITLTPDVFNDGSHNTYGAWAQKLAGHTWKNFTVTDLPTPAVLPTPVSFDGVCRALLAWRDGDGTPNLAFGTNTAFYVLVQGVIEDLTPIDLVSGNANTTSTIGGYGDGSYGQYNYGQGDPTQANLVDAAGWQLDTFGNYIVGVLVPSDGRLFYWDGLTSTLTEMDNAPTDNSGIVVTSERFVVALGAGGDPRLLQWASQETLDVWTPSSSNTAGNFPLPGSGRIMCGRRTKNETLIFTDADLFSMQYIGGAFVYSVVPVGRQCGVVSRNAVAMVNDRAIWMGQSNFFAYTGTVRPLPSDVSDYVFSDINQTQSAKIFATTIAEFGEVWWFYPSAASVENDRYVIYNYVEDHWNTGPLTRLAGIDRSVFDYPIMASVENLYSQEQGFDHIDGVTPFLESGPLELGDGDRLQNLTQLIPDEATQQSQTLGALNASIYTSLYPDQAEVVNGPYTLANPTSIRLTARQLRVRAEEIQAGDWRLGVLRLNTQPGSRR